MNHQTGKTFLKKKRNQPFLRNSDCISLSGNSVFFFILLLLPFCSIAQRIETVIQKGHELAVLSVAVSPDSNLIATASRDKSAKVWDMITGREIRSFHGHMA